MPSPCQGDVVLDRAKTAENGAPSDLPTGWVAVWARSAKVALMCIATSICVVSPAVAQRGGIGSPSPAGQQPQAKEAGADDKGASRPVAFDPSKPYEILPNSVLSDEEAFGPAATPVPHTDIWREAGKAYTSRNYELAFRLYLELAVDGFATAQTYVGQMYEYGTGTHVSGPDAEEWYTQAAGQGDLEGQFRLGLLYLTGHGIAVDLDRAAQWLIVAAERGHAAAQFFLGTMYQVGQGVWSNPETATYWYEKAAVRGYVDAMHELGLAYLKGWGVTKSAADAAPWIMRAADQGLPRSQETLGMLYEHGWGVPKSPTEAVRWYRLAADQGAIGAQASLGMAYLEGLGVKRDLVLAHMWFNLAAMHGGIGGEVWGDMRAEAEKRMSRAQIAEAQRRAVEWKPRRTARPN